MLSTSFAFRKHVSEGRHLDTKVEITFADGTSKTLYGKDLTMGGMTFSAATSSTSGFDIGAAVIGSCEMTLANYGGEWDDADFTGATAVVHVGATYGDGTVEWLRKGVYGVQQPESYDSTVTLACYDNMRLFELDYSEVETAYPASLQTIVTDICQECGVTMLSASFPNDSLVVQHRPDDDSTSCLDVLRWAMQAACCWARMDTWGRLACRWYDTAAFETEDWLDGGSFMTTTTPYSDGDTADGGAFHYGGDSVNGGSFSNSPWPVITEIKSLTTTTDDVVVTGVEVTAAQQVRSDGAQGNDGETYLYGTAGYVLKVADNPLIEYGKAQTVAGTIGASVVGMRFRPLSVTSLGNPAIEAGDPALVVDRRNRSYRTWVTSITWRHGGNQTISCDAETPARNRADAYSAQTRAIVQQRNTARAERTAREQAVANLANQLEHASGLFKTEQEQEDHSIIYYLHDKPTLAESQIIWKLTSQAFGISTDGGETYPFGFDAWGNAILNAIYAIGLNASYINSGTINADLITAGSMSAARITSGTMSAARISGGELKLGGSSDGNGIAQIYDSSNNLCVQLDKLGVRMYHSSSYSTLLQPATYSSTNYLLVTNTSPNSVVAHMHVGGYYGGDLTVGSYTRGPDYYSKISTGTSTLIGSVKIGDCLKVGSNQWSSSTIVGRVYSDSLVVSGYKSRIVSTERYSDRMLYCNEMPAPMFEDVGSGTVDEDGLCVVAVDDIFYETVRTDMAYQVFLQKCGRGDLWVSEKSPTYFVVEGTPGLVFDWRLLAHQAGYELTRLEDESMDAAASTMGIDYTDPFDLYGDELNYAQLIESLH